MIRKRKPALERSVKYLLDGVNRFQSAPTSPLVQIWIETQNIDNTNDQQQKYRRSTCCFIVA